ncbi:MAG: hypothetical protein QHG98_03800 [Methanothrix sp.]|jgi:hypothetical protein|nr:hypothetical protein [Methanothrix sp.]
MPRGEVNFLRAYLDDIRKIPHEPFTVREIGLSWRALHRFKQRGYLRRVGYAPVPRSGNRVSVWEATKEFRRIAGAILRREQA